MMSSRRLRHRLGLPSNTLGRWSLLRPVLLLLGVGGGLACADLGGKPPLPSGIPDPRSIQTAAGARQMYQGAVGTFGENNVIIDNSFNTSLYWGAFLWSVLDQGMLSDELTVSTQGGTAFDYNYLTATVTTGADYALDARDLPEGANNRHVAAYASLQTLRARAAQALGALTAYDTASRALRGHLHALTGYAELLLGDLFCAGVPLSTLNYGGDFTYAPGSPTDSVYAHALTELNQTLALASDSARFVNLARVGRGRAFLNLGRYDSAAAAVHSVPTTWRYDVPVEWTNGTGSPGFLLTSNGIRGGNGTDGTGGDWEVQGHPDLSSINNGFLATMADSEGGRGLPYLSSGDPRTAGVPVATNQFGHSLFFPAKYGDGAGITPIAVASGIEARLIEAEAALHGVPVSGGDWLTILNTLRQTMAPTLGTPLSDPGDSPGDTARIRLLFAERAAWLFLDGHRLGDLRRLLRRYHWKLADVVATKNYPVPHPIERSYHPDIELPIPDQERQVNPFFTGCLYRWL